MGYTLLDDSGKPAKGSYTLIPDEAPTTSAAPQPAKPLGWSDVPGQALKNIPSSAGNFIGGIAQAVRHPIDTALNLGNVGYGAIRGAVPESVGALMDRVDGTSSNPQVAAVTGKARQQASATGQFFKDRYGSAEGIKNTLATDPVGAAADASALLTGGAGLLKLGGKGATALASATGRTAPGIANAMTTAGAALGTAGDAINPVSLAVKGVRKAAPMVGNGAANLIGGLGTHTGAETIKQAFRSGKDGGASAQSFRDNLRGNVPITDVLDDAKSNLEAMGRAKSAEYRQNMAAVTSDKTVLDFTGIDNAVADAHKVATFKGQVKNTKAAQIQQEIADEIANWKALDPAEYHTPEGLDALKQKIGGIVESVPFEQKTARMIGDKVYNAIKTEIVQQAPVYADTMKAYSEATEQIREIERALSLGKKASVDTAMRKLQSLTRNNVNTNYGNRLRLAQEMEQQGGKAIMPALAGQALSSWTPRGLGGAVAGGLGYAGFAAGGVPAAVGTLAVQSPRLMGEAAYATGQAARMAGKAAQPLAPALDPNLLNFLYQSGRLPQN